MSSESSNSNSDSSQREGSNTIAGFQSTAEPSPPGARLRLGFSGKAKAAACMCAALVLAGGAGWLASEAKERTPDGECRSLGDELGGDPEFEKALVKHMEKKFFARINATPEQRSKIATLVESKMETNRGKRDALRSGLKSLVELVRNPQAKDEEITARAHELRNMHQTLMDDRLNTFLAVRALLDDEQKSKLGKRIAKVMEGQGRPRLGLLKQINLKEAVNSDEEG